MRHVTTNLDDEPPRARAGGVAELVDRRAGHHRVRDDRDDRRDYARLVGLVEEREPHALARDRCHARRERLERRGRELHRAAAVRDELEVHVGQAARDRVEHLDARELKELLLLLLQINI